MLLQLYQSLRAMAAQRKQNTVKGAKVRDCDSDRRSSRIWKQKQNCVFQLHSTSKTHTNDSLSRFFFSFFWSQTSLLIWQNTYTPFCKQPQTIKNPCKPQADGQSPCRTCSGAQALWPLQFSVATPSTAPTSRWSEGWWMNVSGQVTDEWRSQRTVWLAQQMVQLAPEGTHMWVKDTITCRNHKGRM